MKLPKKCPQSLSRTFLHNLHGRWFSNKYFECHKNVPEIRRIFYAIANPVEVIIAETDTGRGIIGIIDEVKTKGVESEEDVKKRKEFLRKIGYKF